MNSDIPKELMKLRSAAKRFHEDAMMIGLMPIERQGLKLLIEHLQKTFDIAPSTYTSQKTGVS